MNVQVIWKYNYKIVILFFLTFFSSGCKWLGGDDTALSDINELVSLTVSEGTLSPVFDARTTSYTVEVENTVESIQVTARVEDSDAAITINSIATTSGSASAAIALAVGSNTIVVEVTAANGDILSYTITVTRAEPYIPSDNAFLSGLAVSVGDLIPVFDAVTYSYNVSVTNDIESTTVTPTTEDANATVLVNSQAVVSGSASAAIELDVGDNAISIVVTAEDGTTIYTYEIIVSRDQPLSNDADLSSLALSSGSLSPTFNAVTISYTASVAFATDTISVTPTLSDANATVTVNTETVTSGSASSAINLTVGENTITVIVLAEDGLASKTYTVIVTRQAAVTGYVQEAYIKASNTESDGFSNVAISGDTLVVAAAGEDSNATGINGDQSDNSLENSGAVYVLVSDTNGNWSQQAYIKASNPDAGDALGRGTEIAIDGDTIAVASSLEDSSATGINGDESNNDADGSGAVYIFSRVGADWTQQAYIKASNTDVGDTFGYSLAIDGDTLVVGAHLEDGISTGVNGDDSTNGRWNSGAAYVFVRDNLGVWTQQAYLKASNPDNDDHFGKTVAISGDTIIVGAEQEDSNSAGVNGNQSDNSESSSGAAYVFVRDVNNNWTQQAYLKASNADLNDRFGSSVSISGDTIAVGAHTEGTTVASSGAVYVFRRNAIVWSEEAFIKSDYPLISDAFGRRVSIEGDNLVIGCHAEDSSATGVNGDETDDSLNAAGASYLYVRDGMDTWNKEVYFKASNTATQDAFGYSLDVSGNTVVIAASGEDSAATGINGDQGDNSALSAGAVYVFQPQ